MIVGDLFTSQTWLAGGKVRLFVESTVDAIEGSGTDDEHVTASTPQRFAVVDLRPVGSRTGTVRGFAYTDEIAARYVSDSAESLNWTVIRGPLREFFREGISATFSEPVGG